MEAGAQPLDVAAPPGRPQHQPLGERRRQRPRRRPRAASASARPGRRAPSSRSATPMSTTRVSGGRLALASSGGRPGGSAEPRRGRGGGERQPRRQHEVAQPVDARHRARRLPRPAASPARSRRPAGSRRRAAGRPRAAARPSSRRGAAPASRRAARRWPSRASTAASRLAAGDRRGAGVARARLGVQRLHARPERRRRGEPDEQRRELDRMPAPVRRGARRGPASCQPPGLEPRRRRRAAPPAGRCASTISSAAPVSATSSSRSSSTASPVASSRLPVGSSARISRGRRGQRPADRDPLLLPARELLGVAAERGPRARAERRGRRAGRDRAGRRAAPGSRGCRRRRG